LIYSTVDPGGEDRDRMRRSSGEEDEDEEESGSETDPFCLFFGG
jgi:hypothetical protein